nr:TAXI family TRAP transporter solute-binding subunit [Comamonas koreensis]
MRQKAYGLRQTLITLVLNIRDALVSGGPLVILAVALIVGAYWWLKPNPPSQVKLATGPAQSAYASFGEQYRTPLARNKIRVDLVGSEGSFDNLQLLREGKVDLAFVQGGTADLTEDDLDSLTSLGALFVEPVWLFYRSDAAQRLTKRAHLSNLTQLAGWRVNVGTAGSGVPNLFNQLLEANRLNLAQLRVSHLAETPATVAFLDGKIDALVLVSAPESPMVQMLLKTPGVQLMDFPQNEAYGRKFRFLSPVTLPRGIVDLAANVPPQNVHLLASTTSLLARDDTHPAIKQLFAQASQGIHSQAGWFNRARDFPNTRSSELAVAPEGVRAINEPAPLLQRYLPFWLANLVERMWLVLGVLLAFMLPLSRVVPPLYQFRVRSRVFKWYGQLRAIEHEMEQPEPDRASIQAELLALSRKVEKITVPLSYADELYALRSHIHWVLQKLEQQGRRDGAAHANNAENTDHLANSHA